MTRLDIIVMAGIRLRDPAHTQYTIQLLNIAINQGIDRIKQEIPILRTMNYLDSDSDIPELLPDYYHEMLSIYAQFRALEMDERLYESRIANNEFEVKLSTLKGEIASGQIIIKDTEGNEITETVINEQIKDTYYQGIPYDTTKDGRYNYTDERDEFDSTDDGCGVTG